MPLDTEAIFNKILDRLGAIIGVISALLIFLDYVFGLIPMHSAGRPWFIGGAGTALLYNLFALRFYVVGTDKNREQMLRKARSAFIAWIILSIWYIGLIIYLQTVEVPEWLYRLFEWIPMFQGILASVIFFFCIRWVIIHIIVFIKIRAN